ncbi:MAG TPA: twin-arginine translocase TatA/TatE family subunit [Xanthobacteraceae bacterium]|nr:twin-arginine translocase TatA/TatE family subunit [Xanthobacteraceae bacterium]
MGFGSPWHWILVAVVILLLFGGRGKISSLMGDFAEGIKAFKKGMREDKPEDAAKDAPMKSIDHASTAPGSPTAETKRSESRV